MATKARSKSKAKILSERDTQAIAIVTQEKNQWENAVCWVTEKVGFRMRQLIRIVRKNYWGVFDEPFDDTTQRDKKWIPLILSIIENIVKNIDLDTKDISFRAKNEGGFITSKLARHIVKEYLDNWNFGDILDETERQLCIDGTHIWKTWTEGKEVYRRSVDLLNFYIDPTENNIQEAYRVTERAVLTPDQVASMSGWSNTEDLKGSKSLNKYDGRGFMGTLTTGSFVDVWEMWGKIPKSMLSLDPNDKDEIDGHIVVSGIDSGDARVHLIEENTKKDSTGCIIKPYEEVRVGKIAGRWYGFGFAERLLALQEYLNTVHNIRINKNFVSQLGLFQVRKGSGITPQNVARLVSNGAISVNEINRDIAPLQIPSADATSYRDEEVIKEWSSQVAQAFPVSSGEPLPSAATATAVAIQNTNAKSAYTMVKDAMGNLIKRWLDRHALKPIVSNYKKGDIIRILGEDETFGPLVDRVVARMAMDSLNSSEGIPTQQEFDMAVQSARQQLIQNGTLFLEIAHEITSDHIDTEVHVTNEDLDSSVTVQNLIQLLQIDPQQRDAILPQIYTLLGIDVPVIKAPMPQGQMPQSQGTPNGVPSNMPTPQGIQQHAMMGQVPNAV